MTVLKMKVVYSLAVLAVITLSTTARMIITKKDSVDPILAKEPNLEQNQDFSQPQLIHQERNLLQQQNEDLPERQLKQTKKPKKTLKKKPKKSLKKKPKNAKKSRKLNIESIDVKTKKEKKMLKKIKYLVKKHGANPQNISKRKLIQILKGKKSKNRKLWWWWWRRRQEAERRRREAERRRREAERRRREAERRRRIHQANIRTTLKRKEKNFLLELQRTKLKQLDRNKFDKLMLKERKKDSELWSRTFIYDAILLTEKLVYMEHEKMFKKQMKLAVANENKEKAKLLKFYNKNYGKKMKELTPEEIEEDIFM